MNQPALFDLTDAGQPVRPFIPTQAVAEPQPEPAYVPDANQSTLPGLEEL